MLMMAMLLVMQADNGIEQIKLLCLKTLILLFETLDQSNVKLWYSSGIFFSICPETQHPPRILTQGYTKASPKSDQSRIVFSFGVLWQFTQTGGITSLGVFSDAFAGHKMRVPLQTAPAGYLSFTWSPIQLGPTLRRLTKLYCDILVTAHTATKSAFIFSMNCDDTSHGLTTKREDI
jgi:hypothetical protein